MTGEEFMKLTEGMDTDTELVFPEELTLCLEAFNTASVRRRVYIFHGEHLLPRPDVDYQIVFPEKLILPFLLKTLDILTVAIPSIDERWYYSHADGWGRL
jgi:hypothetical protein